MFAVTELARDPDKTGSELVEDYVVRDLLAAEARRIGLDRDPEIAQRFREARRDLLLETSQAALAADVAVSDEDVAAYYEEKAGELNRPERVRTRIILRRLPANASRRTVQEELDRLRAAQAQFLSGASFADLAVQYSQHESAAVGGVMQPLARDEIGPQLEAVVARLEPGEVSEVVRLPQGLALVQLEGVDPATSVPFEEVALELRGELLRERRDEHLQERLDEARAQFPTRIENRPLVSAAAVDEPVVFIGDDALTLADLGLAHRPPFLREAVERAVADELLLRLAEQHAGDATRAELAQLRNDVVAAVMLERLVRAQLPEANPNELLDRYARERERFERPERRVFEVVHVTAERGNLQDARAAVEAIARIWRPGGPVHQQNRAEVWGPIAEDRLAAATSSELARAAFALAPGETSTPVLVEPGAGGGDLAYVLLRVEEILPAGVIPYDEARDELVEQVESTRLEAARTRVRAELLQQAELKILPPLFACDVRAPAAAPVIEADGGTTETGPTTGSAADATESALGTEDETEQRR